MRPFEILAPFVFLTLAACGGTRTASPAPVLPDPGSDGVYSVDWPDLGRGDARFITIDLGPDEFLVCRRVSPKFPFDSAMARAQDKAQLAALASCLNHAEMADRTVMLIGRADARGSAANNDVLGAKRAQAVKKILVANGLAEARIRVSTRGEADAVGEKPGAPGTPQYSHGYDRSVDVVIRRGAHAP
jgi:OmpA-OmpF porin, OOP family